MPGRACFRRVAELEASSAGRSRSPPSWRSSVRPRPGPGPRASSIPTARSRAGSAAAAPSPSSSARRCARSSDGQPRLLRLSKDGARGGSPGRRRRRARHDLPLGGHAGDLRGAAPSRAVALDRRHDADRRGPRDRSARRPAGGCPCSTRRRRRGVPRCRAGVDGDRARRRDRPELSPVRRRRHPGDLGRGGARRARSGATCLVRRADRLADPGRRRPRVAARRGQTCPRSGSPRCGRPAGMDLGAETPEEVAVSILAELVQVRRGRASFVATPGPATLVGGAGAAAGLERDVASAPVVDDIVLAGPGLRHDRRPGSTPGTSPSTTASSTPSARMGCRTAFIRSPARTSPARPHPPRS